MGAFSQRRLPFGELRSAYAAPEFVRSALLDVEVIRSIGQPDRPKGLLELPSQPAEIVAPNVVTICDGGNGICSTRRRELGELFDIVSAILS